MCGRLTQISKTTRYAELLGVTRTSFNAKPTYNLAPTQPITICRTNGERSLVQVRWGLIPHWAKEIKHGYSTINARAETILTKPAYRDAFKKRRCLIPTDGFYEWRQSTPKQPFFIHRKDNEPFALAGILERWQHEGEVIESAAIIVTSANKLMQPIHDRMPVIINPWNFETWLSHENDGNDFFALLLPHSEMDFEAYPVSTKVNKPANNDPSIIESIKA